MLFHIEYIVQCDNDKDIAKSTNILVHGSLYYYCRKPIILLFPAQKTDIPIMS